MACLAACAVGLGCGNDSATGTGDETAATAQAPQPNGTAAGAAKRLARLLASTARQRDCDAIEAVNKRSSYDFRCPQLPPIRRSMARFEVISAAEHGTGATVYYRTAKTKDGAAMILYAARDGRWGIGRFGLLYEASDGTEETREGFDAAVKGYLRAVAEGDCDLYRKHALTEASDRRTICKRELPGTSDLADSLDANPDATPAFLGGDDSFGFYGLAMAKPKPHYLTISVVRTAPGALRPFLVMDVVQGPSVSRADVARMQATATGE